MTVFIPSANTITPFNLGLGDFLYVGTGIQVSYTGGAAVAPLSVSSFRTDFSIVCDGTIAGARGVVLQGISDIYIGTSGNVIGEIGLEATDFTPTKLGTFATINNDGKVYGSAFGIIVGLNETVLGATISEIHNTGSIKSGFLTTGDFNGTTFVQKNGAVVIEQNAPIFFENSGLVQALKAGSWAYESVEGNSIDTVINTGTMIGKVALGANNDIFDTSGGKVVGNISGNDGNDRITGSALADTIYGGSGNDTLTGNAGDDILIGDAGADRLDGGAGIDTVSYFSSAAGVNVNLATGAVSGGDAAGDVLISIENVIGSTAANVLTGNTVANRLNGGGGSDTLNGGLGNDVLTGGLGSDFFEFRTAPGSANVDTITDFNFVNDVIRLENTGAGMFNTLALGFLNPNFLKQNATGVATDADDRIVYNTTTGALFYDSNGNAAGGAVQFALLTGHPTIVAADFLVI